MDEKGGILGAQNHILVTNNRAASAGTQKLNFYREALQVFRLPKSHLEVATSFRRGDGNVFNLAGMAVQRFFSSSDTLNRGARPGGGEWGDAEIWMAVMYAGRGRDPVGFEAGQIRDEVTLRCGVFHSYKVAGTVHMGFRNAFAHFHHVSDH